MNVFSKISGLSLKSKRIILDEAEKPSFKKFEIIITAEDAARGEGLLYLPFVKTRIPVEWQGLTVNEGLNGEYGCVMPDGEVQMQGSQTRAISNDLYRQVPCGGVLDFSVVEQDK